MRAKLKFKGKEIVIEDIERVKGMKKFSGLMFNKSGNALLFEFEKLTNEPITSIFCPDFLAIWLNQGKIVDYRLIVSNRFSIKPKAEFTSLLEIPLNNKYNNVVKFFLGKEKV